MVEAGSEPIPAVATTEASPEFTAATGTQPTLTLQEATDRLSPEILQALEDKFNGSLVELRAPDEKDQFFQ